MLQKTDSRKSGHDSVHAETPYRSAARLPAPATSPRDASPPRLLARSPSLRPISLAPRMLTKLIRKIDQRG